MRLKKWILLGGAFMILGLANIAIASSIYNGSEYALTSLGLTWLEAEAEAVAWGGHLVTINDQAEQDWLATTFPYTEYPNLYIGMNDIAEEGNWGWSSGEAVTYTNWAPGEPNNSDGILPDGSCCIPEHVAVMNWGNPEYNIPFRDWWNDLPVASQGQGIMARPVPEPSTILLLTAGLSGMIAYSFSRKKKT